MEGCKIRVWAGLRRVEPDRVVRPDAMTSIVLTWELSSQNLKRGPSQKKEAP